VTKLAVAISFDSGIRLSKAADLMMDR